MTEAREDRRPASGRRVAELACLAIAALLFALTAFTVSARVAFPFPLEWQETAMAEHALRQLAGEAIYVQPSAEFAPFPYPPLFHWLGAASMSVFGAGLLPLRVVSVVATLGLLAVLVCLPREGAARFRSGAIAAGWFAGAFALTGAWFDVARVDMLALALVALALALASPKGRSLWTAAGIGILLALATLTKQTMLAMLVAVPLGMVMRESTRRAGCVAGGVGAVVLGAAVLALERGSDGWFLFTTVDLLAGSPWHGPAIGGFWLETAPLFALPALLYFLAGRPEIRAPLGVAALIGIAWAGRAHEGGFTNTLLPGALAAAWVLAHAIGPSLSRAPRWTALAFAISAAWLAYDPRPFLPLEADQRAATHALARIDALAPGDEAIVWQPGGSLRATDRGGVHQMAIVDLLKSTQPDAARSFAGALQEALDTQRFDAIVLSRDVTEWGEFAPLILSRYRIVERFDSLPFTCQTGAPIGPRLVLLPR